MDLDRYQVSRRGAGFFFDKESLPIAKELLKVIEEHTLTYEQAKGALDLTDQILLNKLLSKTKMHRPTNERLNDLD